MAADQARITLLRQAQTALRWAERAILQAERHVEQDQATALSEIHAMKVYVKRVDDLISAQIAGVAPASTVMPRQRSFSSLSDDSPPNSTSSTDTPK